MKRFVLICWIALLGFPILGCASFGERHLKVRSRFEQGRLEEAQAEIDRALKKKRRGETDVLNLNRAIISLCNGKPKEAETLLRQVRDRFDENERKIGAGEAALSMVTDDTVKSYAGEDYEKVLIRVFLALSNLMYDGTDAPAYALQIGAKQNEIIGKGKTKSPENSEEEVNLKQSYRQVAIGPYLIGAMTEETYRDFDEVVRAYEAVCAWEPNFSQGRRDLERARHGTPCAPGNGVLYVFGLVGPGPYKIQRNCEVLQAAQIWTTAIIGAVGSRPVIPDFAPIMLPVVVRPSEVVPSLRVSVDGQFAALTETITDIGRMAEEQFEAVYPQIVARAVIRRALKKGILYGTKEAVDANSWVGLAMDVGGMIWEGMETADTRCWNLLPAEIQVARIELPAGEHRIALQPSSRVFSLSNRCYLVSEESMPFGGEHSKVVRVGSGRNTYVLANFPGENLVGQIVVSNDLEEEPSAPTLAP